MKIADLELLGKYCGCHVVDYGNPRGDSLLLGSGCGIMMAVMDVDTEFKWCCDLDGGGNGLDLAIISQRHIDMIGLVGWFSYTSPRLFTDIMTAGLSVPVVAYGGNVDLGCHTLAEFLDRCKEVRRAIPKPESPLYRDGWKWSRVPYVP